MSYSWATQDSSQFPAHIPVSLSMTPLKLVYQPKMSCMNLHLFCGDYPGFPMLSRLPKSKSLSTHVHIISWWVVYNSPFQTGQRTPVVLITSGPTTTHHRWWVNIYGKKSAVIFTHNTMKIQCWLKAARHRRVPTAQFQLTKFKNRQNTPMVIEIRTDG